MKINFSPIRMDNDCTISVSGDVLNINGESFDFSPLNNGDELPAEAVGSIFFVGNITKISGVVEVTILLPHGVNAPVERRFPSQMVVTSGNVPLPPYDEGV